MLAGPVAAAQASDAQIRGTVKADVPKIIKSQAKILDGLATYEKTHSAKPLISASEKQNRVLKALETKLSRESSSTAAGAKGKADIIKGLKLIVGSNTILIKHLQSGQPLSASQQKAAVSAAKKGNSDLNAGGRLLKV